MEKNTLNSLYLRISLLLFVILVFVGLAYTYITINSSETYSQQISQRLNKDVAKNIVEHSAPIYNGTVNQQAWKKIFENVMSVNPSLEVYLLDTTGKIISYIAPDKKIQLNQIAIEPIRQLIGNSQNNELLLNDDPLHPGIKKVFSAYPIMNMGMQYAYLYVVLASEEYVAVSQSLSGSFLMRVGMKTMLITLIATFLLGLVLIRILTRNFSRMIEVMQKFREGDLSARIKTKSTGDVQQMGTIFNEMADILTQNIEKLKEVEILRRELVANVSHDLRTPIAIIHGYVETLQMKGSTLSVELKTQYLNTIEESTSKLDKLVSELFELSKLEANQVTPKKEPFQISDLLNDISRKYHLIASDKKISIDTLLSKELPPVMADVALIERVMQNLIDNAMKFTPAGGKITIETIMAGKEVKVTVVDTGIGIPEKERDQVFSRYYKGNNFTDLKNSTGLGLAIVKKILDLHDSSLHLSSKVNEGSSFVFRLPVYQVN